MSVMSKGEIEWMHRLEDLERLLGYKWWMVAHLRQACTHSSFGNKHRRPHNERLELLGDSVMDLIVVGKLAEDNPAWDEGRLSIARAEIVCTTRLADVARKLGLSKYLQVYAKSGADPSKAAAECERIRTSERTLAGMVESIVGAVYMDQRGRGGELSSSYGVMKRMGVLS